MMICAINYYCIQSEFVTTLSHIYYINYYESDRLASNWYSTATLPLLMQALHLSINSAVSQLSLRSGNHCRLAT